MLENIVHSMQDEKAPLFAEQKLTVYGSLLVVAYLLFAGDCASLLLTAEDRDLMWHLVLYACVQAGAQHLYDPRVVRGSRISLLTACITLVTLRLHYSFDNLYTLVLTLLFGTRSMFKFLSAVVLLVGAGHFALLLLDSFTFCSLLENGLMATSSGPLRGAQAQLLVVLLSFLLVAAILAYTSRHAASVASAVRLDAR